MRILWLLDVRPRSAKDNLADLLGTDAVLAPQCRLGFSSGISLADCPNLVGGQLSAASVLAPRYGLPQISGPATPATLGGHIAHVVHRGSQPQMRRVHARRIVAVVEDLDSKRNGSIQELPRQPVSSFERTFPGSHLPIAEFISVPLPFPAFTNGAIGDIELPPLTSGAFCSADHGQIVPSLHA